MSAAKACRRVSSVIALPPYLTTTILSCSALSHGSAAASTSRLAWRSAVAVMSCTPSSLRRSRGTGRWCGSTPAASPTPRSIVTSMSAPDRSTSRAPGAPTPSTHTGEPLKDTLIRFGSRRTGAMPTAASTRPQLASEPNSAVLTRLSRATTRAAVSASASEAAPVTVTTTRLVTPSASACNCAHRSSHTRSTASSRSLWLGAISLAPEASSSTVSLVEQLPSTSSRSKVSAVARRSAWSSAAASATASVVMTLSMVASDGASMPAPLAMPPTVQLSSVVQRNLFGHGVGGHDGAGGLLAAGQPAGHLMHDLAARRPAPCPSAAGRRSTRSSRRRPRSRRFRCPSPQRGGDGLGGGVGVLEAAGSGAGVRAAGVQDHRAQPSGGQHLLRPQHRRGLDLVAGEHACGAVVGALVEHQRQVQRAGRLDARGDAGGAETRGRGDALGAYQPRLLDSVGAAWPATSDSVTAPPPRSRAPRSPASRGRGSSTAPPRRRCP